MVMYKIDRKEGGAGEEREGGYKNRILGNYHDVKCE